MIARTARVVPWDEIKRQQRDRAAKAPGVPQDVGACKSEKCLAAIRWGITMDGDRMPVDFTPDPHGNLVRVMVAAGDWRLRVLEPGETVAPGTHRWTSHFATCPDAGAFRPAGNAAASVARTARALKLATPPPAPATGTLLAVDGNSLAHRAFYAYEKTGMTAPDGRPVFAVYGFVALLAGILDKVSPDALVVGFDDRSSSVRRDAYPDYKAQRGEKDPDLYAQMNITATVLESLGVPVTVAAGLEADDVLGSAAAAAESAGWQCVIATSDRDAFALISEHTTVLRLVNGLDNAVRMTPDRLLEEYGVRPDQYLDYAAMVGDKSDNLPGVMGIGPKTAVKLLAALGDVDSARKDRAATTAAVGPAAAAKLSTDDAAAALERNRSIMAIRRDLPMDLERCKLRTTPDTVATVLGALHLSELVDRVTAALCPPAPSSTPRQRGHLAAVPPALAELGPTTVAPRPDPVQDLPAPPLVRADPPPVCPDCDRECLAALPLAQLDNERRPTLTGEQVLVDSGGPLGDLVAVLVGDVWAVTPVPAGEHCIRMDNRRRSHSCPVYPHTCARPGCGKPGRLYATGTWCDEDVPATPRPHRPGDSRPTA